MEKSSPVPKQFVAAKRMPRLQLHELRADLADYLRRANTPRIGELGEFFQCAGQQPDALLAFMSYSDALGNALPRELVAVVCLTVAGVMESEYERNQHEQHYLNAGFPQEWLAAVDRLAPEKSAELSPVERVVQRYTLACVVRRGIEVDMEFEAMLDFLTPAEAMAVAMLVGRCVCLALIVNTLGLEPPVPSIFERP
jgi:alkylhydroperoxidase family enzyme